MAEMKKNTIQLLQETNALPEGCKRCIEGEKMVLFVTGMCPASCFFCPLSEEKKNKDVIYANERHITGNTDEQIRNLIKEAKENKATGAGVTGGDPLARIDRTCSYIMALKAEFGKDFHIHLYTPLILVNEYTMARLAAAGLDEIRFHPFMDDEKNGERLWERMELARKYQWKVGIEIPVFPDKVPQTKRLIAVAARYVDFINLNQLEVSERTFETFKKIGYEPMPGHGVKGSKEAAVELIKFARELRVPTHYCPAKLKDHVQMGNRIKRRAENVAQSFDEVNDEGLLTRGAIYINYSPREGYAKVLSSITEEQHKAELKGLVAIYAWLQQKGMPQDAGMLDLHRLRILLSADALRDLAPALKKRFPKTVPAVITEYPTSDAFLVELEEL